MKNPDVANGAGTRSLPLVSPMNKHTDFRGTENKHGAAPDRNIPRGTPRGDARMSSTPENILDIPWKVFQALDPVERIVIRALEVRGEVRITGAPEEV